MTTLDEVRRRFTYYGAPDKAVTYDDIRGFYVNLARYLSVYIPEGLEKELTFIKLEESLRWSIAAIVRPPSIKLSVDLSPDV